MRVEEKRNPRSAWGREMFFMWDERLCRRGGRLGTGGIRRVWWLFEDSSGRSELGKWCCGSDSALGTGSLGGCDGNVCTLAQGWAPVAQWCTESRKKGGSNHLFLQKPHLRCPTKDRAGMVWGKKSCGTAETAAKSRHGPAGTEKQIFFPRIPEENLQNLLQARKP